MTWILEQEVHILRHELATNVLIQAFVYVKSSQKLVGFQGTGYIVTPDFARHSLLPPFRNPAPSDEDDQANYRHPVVTLVRLYFMSSDIARNIFLHQDKQFPETLLSLLRYISATLARHKQLLNTLQTDSNGGYAATTNFLSPARSLNKVPEHGPNLGQLDPPALNRWSPGHEPYICGKKFAAHLRMKKPLTPLDIKLMSMESVIIGLQSGIEMPEKAFARLPKATVDTICMPNNGTAMSNAQERCEEGMGLK
ncbi:hypothetical protein P154DRAFT_583386 [Amniculicola lignicola CBS 123094]|uniref:Uncharacterized protein n=1 Tax=Amniculicola lignicola CBS 123094 TaxID=1392246 RepID=A0A6A5VVW6_9PLEO|nr:hypothetical protein P154DRAFT_583386 [Amniculicola lignicola CBS 123094]